MIKNLSGVIIWTNNLDNLASFYRYTLGLQPHSTRPNFVSFKWDNIRLSIGFHSRVQGHTTEPNRIMVNLGVNDIHATHQSLLAKGVRFTRPPEKEQWGGWISTFLDPDGNTLQLLQQPHTPTSI